MAITYPLNTPTNLGIANIVLSAENAVALSQSPFTFQQQIVAHPGQRWAASVSLPPMKRQDAEYWVAFLLSLKGQVGTFLLGDPNCVDAQGSATTKRNLLAYTEEFDNAAWAKSSGTTATANQSVAPDGTTTADLVTSGGAAGYIFPPTGLFAAAGGATYTYSAYAKAGTATTIRLLIAATGTYEGVYNLSTGVATTASANTTVSMLDVGNGWYRCILTCANVANTVYTEAQIGRVALGLTFSLWGAQLELGSSATTYQGVADAYGPFVNGPLQTGNTLVIDGCSPNVTGFFLPGDYIQLGATSSAQLYKVLTQVDTDGSGAATIDIWPDLRSVPGDGDAVVVVNTKGRFRLKDNVQQWQINNISSYGITFDCVEAI